ncbi:MAG: glycoside hydrolase family 3 C-terminal domain-containing protein [Anaerolineaceae bacterium]|nr:glycoside hydrolase family 3 C-terminal domain-containing protein [Anaerolineaceae bacterium]
MSENIQAIVNKMTLEEKAALCTGASAWTTTPVERLGIPEIVVSDGPHGVRRVADVNSMNMNSRPATCFPTASCLASTWDTDLLHTMGEALAEEAIALNVDVLLGPGVNMKRSPLGGRNFEYFSEDPYLAGELAVGLINGIQSKGVGTSLKHYAANNQEFHRLSISVEVDERTLHETYLAAFEKAVKVAKPWTVMCAYNKVNGDYCSEHHKLLTEILKNDWKYEGFVVSDWGAVHERVTSLVAGLDLEMPGPQERRVKAVADAVRNGTLDESILDDSVGRILGIVFKAKKTPKTGSFDAAQHHILAEKIASEGMVLLKNNGVLPLKDIQQIAVIGQSAMHPYYQGGGSSHINATQVDIPFKELQSRSENVELAYVEGYANDDSFHQELIDEAVKTASEADAAILYIAPPPSWESEGYDRQSLDLPKQHITLIKSVTKVQPNTVVVLNNGAPVGVGDWIDDVAAVLESWMMGQAGSAAIADILYGRINPSGKLAETIPHRIEDTPPFLNWPGETGKVFYGERMFIGYRYYEAKSIDVQYPFGYGLSYTSFQYSNPRLSSTSFKDKDGLTVSVDITNTGSLAGKEIIQIYVHDHESTLIRPEKELKGFAKVDLQPGETKTVDIHLDFRAFAFYHPIYKDWITENGAYDILIAASSIDIRHTLTANLECTLHLPCILDKESTIREWMDDPRGKIIMTPMFEQIQNQARRTFASDESEDNGNNIGMDVMDMFTDMPLLSVFAFQQSALTMPAEEMLDSLLNQLHNLE